MPKAECISDGGDAREPCECYKQSNGLLTCGGAAWVSYETSHRKSNIILSQVYDVRDTFVVRCNWPADRLDDSLISVMREDGSKW